MSQSARLAFKVIHASSCDPSHPAEELEHREHRGKGWQSARFCDYPQELVIELDNISDIKQVQILSHQSKITTKIEIWSSQARSNSDWTSVSWTRLGYLTLDKNERSNWKARELKSVYIDTKARYVKFALHESHINSINLFNQVGVVALNVLGKKTRENSIDDLAFDMDYDETTAKKIRALTQRKNQAVEMEDYDEAKRCKLSIERLKQAGAELARLEREKAQAVQQEDYDKAKSLKIQIQRLRNIPTESQANNQNYPPPNNHVPHAEHYHNPPTTYQAGHPSQGQRMPPVGVISQQNFGPVRGQRPPSIEHSGPPSQKLFPSAGAAVIGNMNRSRQQQSRSNSHTPPSYISQRSLHPDERPIRANPQYIDGELLDSPAAKRPAKLDRQTSDDERQIRPMRRQPENVEEAANPFGERMGGSQTESQSPVQRKEGVPEALRPAVRKDAETLIEMFGEHTVQCLYSQTWALRDQGLHDVSEFVRGGSHTNSRQVFKLTCKILHKALTDRVAGVFLSGVELVNNLLDQYGPSLGGEEIAKFMQPVATCLVNSLGHSNPRIVEGAGTALITIANADGETCVRMVFSELIKPMKRALPKHLKGRGVILLDLLAQFGVPKSFSPANLMQFVKPLLLNKQGEVRDIGVQMTTICFQHFGNSVLRYLEDLNDFLKETLNQSFEDATGQAHVLERDPRSVKEQNRPSRNRTRAPRPKKKPTGGGRKPQGKKNRNKSKGQSPQRKSSPQKRRQQRQDAAPPEPEFEDAEDMCNFCGVRDAAFAENEENLDLHYWQNCPMLTSCKLCEQVIEIPTLHEHILGECEAAIEHELCPKCNVPYPTDSLDKHVQENSCRAALPLSQANRCPLCLEDIAPGEDGWRQHLLEFPGCPNNERSPPQN